MAAKTGARAVVSPIVGGMEDAGLGDLLVLMVNAHRSFTTLRGEVRIWHHNERSHEAVMRAHAARVAAGSSASIAQSAEGSEPQPVESEHLLRVWLAPPDRLREELVTTSDGKRSVSTAVHVGDVWWSYDPAGGAQTNAGSRASQIDVHLPRAVIDPGPLLSSRVLEIAGDAVHAGRPAIRLIATPSPAVTFPWQHGAHAGEWPQELLVDAERGIVLRCASLLHGEPFAIVEFLAVAFDEELPDAAFVFEPPAGEELRDVRGVQRGQLGPIRLQRAVECAPFGIYVPARVPDDWRLHVYFSEQDERRRWPAAVHLHYTEERATLNVNLNEHAAGGLDIPSSAPDGSPWSVVHTEHGPLRIWEPAEGERGMPRIALIEIAGTRIQISTDDLDAAAITRLAASLVPAPSTP
jgi:outer membrane lipoprotein-sorting protein